MPAYIFNDYDLDDKLKIEIKPFVIIIRLIIELKKCNEIILSNSSFHV